MIQIILHAIFSTNFYKLIIKHVFAFSEISFTGTYLYRFMINLFESYTYSSLNKAPGMKLKVHHFVHLHMVKNTRSLEIQERCVCFFVLFFSFLLPLFFSRKTCCCFFCSIRKHRIYKGAEVDIKNACVFLEH